MKRSINDKFKTKFVTPLYKKSKIYDRDKVDKSVVDFDRTTKLCGNDFNVKTVIVRSGANVVNVKRKISKEYKIVLPGECDKELRVETVPNFNKIYFTKVSDKRTIKCSDKAINNLKNYRDKMLDSSKLNETRNKSEHKGVAQAGFSKTIIFHEEPDTWLRLYPAPKLPQEPLCSVILRCILCQMGLTTVLVLWTIVAVFVIQSFEGPNETKVSVEFEKEQNQLIIDLATELRQIAPLSPKWRYAIERRIEDERQLTMQAVAAGAMLKPGQFWDLSGTFLFAVYVMTALGFGAPVPHTILGRTSALVYAVLAIPTHIFLMVNASTNMVVRVEKLAHYVKDTQKVPGLTRRENKGESSDCSRNSELSEESPRKRGLCKLILQCFGVIASGRGIPLATIVYYIVGVLTFGVLRNRTAVETVMFPLEFTTTGGLEHVEWYIRILYGFYVEGAMCLLACALATIRRNSSSALSSLSDNYRLFESEVCEDCDESRRKEKA